MFKGKITYYAHKLKHVITFVSNPIYQTVPSLSKVKPQKNSIPNEVNVNNVKESP